jgi:predicted phosphodiesterase
MKNHVRIIIPDSHGAHIDVPARDAFLADLKALDPQEIVLLGDHLDCGGTFNTHQRTYTHEMTESYQDDVNAANRFLDMIQRRAPRARLHYIEGNHEQHVERWASREFQSHKDAEMVMEHFGPQAVLRLKARGISYYKRSTMYMGLSIPGTIRLGKCFFVHGVSHSKHAAATHLARFGANVVFGHVHRVQAVVERTVTSAGFGAWCPGTLAKLQPLYVHTAPTSWSHGYGCQFVAGSGNFIHVNVPILKGKSLLHALRA